jgi:hypothetical protein
MNKDTVDTILDGFLDLKSRILEVATYWSRVLTGRYETFEGEDNLSFSLSDDTVTVLYTDRDWEDGVQVYTTEFPRELLWRKDWQERVKALKAEQDERERVAREERDRLRRVVVDTGHLPGWATFGDGYTRRWPDDPRLKQE